MRLFATLASHLPSSVKTSWAPNHFKYDYVLLAHSMQPIGMGYNSRQVVAIAEARLLHD
jgi:hypothetical protein